MAGWSFPSNNYGQIMGIGEAGIETFKGSPYRSLAREICQNSMDAQYDSAMPVKIEFSRSTINNKDVPDYDTLHEAIISCLNFWTELKNEKTIRFFKKAKEVIENSQINILRISDYNTTGLRGSDKDYNTDWQNLVKATGVSDKSGSAGGSFGIGKSAPFACSSLRTIFYSTQDIDGLKATQGIARLVSFREKGVFGREKNSITSGIGYYSASKKNDAIKNCMSIETSYQRESCGTDIYIVGFETSKDWQSEVIASILDEFLLSIYKNRLLVKVDGVEICLSNLSDLVEKFKKYISKVTYDYYQVLAGIDGATKLFTYTIPSIGMIELYVQMGQYFHRKAMMCRNNGMKVFDLDHISGTIQFAAICILKDNEVTQYFRNMENPQHNKWEPERHPDGKIKAKNNVDLIKRFIKEKINELGETIIEDSSDAEGMGEFFADISFTNTDNNNKSEAVSTATSNIEISKRKPKQNTSGKEYSSDVANELNADLDEDGYDDNYGNSGSKDRHDDASNLTNNGTGFGQNEGDGPGTNGIGDNRYQSNIIPTDFDESKAFPIGTMNVRLILKDRANSTYYLSFTPKKSVGHCFLVISLAGEQSSVTTPILEAESANSHKKLKCVNNRIYLDNVVTNVQNKLSFRIDYKAVCSMEVKLYGNS